MPDGFYLTPGMGDNLAAQDRYEVDRRAGKKSAAVSRVFTGG